VPVENKPDNGWNAESQSFFRCSLMISSITEIAAEKFNNDPCLRIFAFACRAASAACSAARFALKTPQIVNQKPSTETKRPATLAKLPHELQKSLMVFKNCSVADF
jgi:uncharacterized protein YuzB (UPF0349 family)